MATAKETTPTSTSKESNEKAAGDMEEELAGLTSQFRGQCKVIDTTGRFVKTVKLHPENLDIVFNFKLLDSYPSSTPVIEIRSQSLDDDDMFDLHGFMTQTAESMAPVSLQGLVEVALEWLHEGNISVKGNRQHKQSTQAGERRDRKNKKTKERKNKNKEHVAKGKKPPMKTAIDVVKRILWDGDLQQDQFLVGYLDRIDGLKEKYFNAFSWEDIASVDYTVLAIPKHRIQYFKYKNEIVWDKRCRLDNMFGSTGSRITIKEVIARIDGKVANRDENADADEIENADTHHDSDYYDSGDFSDSDSDDGITVTIDSAARGANGGGQEYGLSDDEDVNNDHDTDGNLDKYWRDKLRPNYFIALRITDEDIRREFGEVQNYITENEPKFNGCCIPKAALHITLCTVGLETPEQVQNAVRCLKEVHSELKSIVPKDQKLRFKGVDNFFNRVIFGRVIDCPPEFYELVEHLKLCLIEQGIEIRDYHEFVPHMTVMKISRPVARATGKKYIPPWLYSCFNEFEFGSQSVDNIHLCEMGDDRQEDGFYISALSLDL